MARIKKPKRKCLYCDNEADAAVYINLCKSCEKKHLCVDKQDKF